MNNHFPDTYEESRTNFRQSLAHITPLWPNAELDSHTLSGSEENLSIDWIWADSARKENLVIVSTGQHGIEGYVGAAMLDLFIETFVRRLDPEHTGLLLVHTINPWGMKYHRKVNQSNVDLNRNFIMDGEFDQSVNPDYRHLKFLLVPQRPVRAYALENLLFWGGVVRALLTRGVSRTSAATLLGQYHTPTGFFFGGDKLEENTTVMMDLYHQAFESYDRVTHMDMHTGYGPRYQMSVLLTSLESMSSSQAVEKFNYPLVLETNPDEFYSMSGDMIDYVYKLKNKHFPEKDLFSCNFEFGTFGETLLDRIRSMKAMVMENQLYWHKSTNQAAAGKVLNEFEELYFPAEDQWREKTLQDARQAFEGILKARYLLQNVDVPW